MEGRSMRLRTACKSKSLDLFDRPRRRTTVLPRYRSLAAIPSMAPIPEDSSLRLGQPGGVEEEPVTHRSPVSLDNGYRPTTVCSVRSRHTFLTRQHSLTVEEEQDSPDEGFAEEEDHEPQPERSQSLSPPPRSNSCLATYSVTSLILACLSLLAGLMLCILSWLLLPPPPSSVEPAGCRPYNQTVARQQQGL